MMIESYVSTSVESCCFDSKQAGLRCLLDVLGSVPDPRDRRGIRHPIEALLGLLVISLCTGQQTVKDAVVFGRERRRVRKALGFVHHKCPSQSTYTRLFQVMEVETLREVISNWLSQLTQLWNHKQSRQVAVSVDGKTLRGSAVHTLNVFVQDYWGLLDQYEVDLKANEMSCFRSRLTEFLERYPFVRILTFDALFCESQTMEALTKNNRLGIFQVKENQPEGLARLERWFAKQPQDAPDFQETEKKWRLHRPPPTVVGQCTL